MVLHLLNPCETDTVPRKTLLFYGSDVQLRTQFRPLNCIYANRRKIPGSVMMKLQIREAHFPLSRQTSFEEGGWETRAASDIVKHVVDPY